jgi:pimeloyl-ACP methyl ester carboxylesterase/2-polyprenyl-6-methoxyphenol hydroxylase-like FAD-dependent oxidoreductase
MAEILVLGAGLNGLTTAMLLARDGHRVTVLERDAAEPAGDADANWETWERSGVNQFRQLHFMLPRWRTLMERELPEVIEQVEAFGGLRINVVGMLPPERTGGQRPGDERFDTVTARRPVLESAVTAVADRTPGVTIRRGVAITGLVTGETADQEVPHVAGVMAGGGEAIRADLVIDATGRRSQLPTMLEAVGVGRPVEEREDSGFVYYARHFRAKDGNLPAAQAMLLQHFDSVSVLTLPCDNGTWGVGFTTSSRDRELRALRDPTAWDRAIALYPSVAHWAAGEPITDVQVIAGIEDRYRRYVVDGRPVVTGLLAVGDAWACTNPSLGRGTSIGMVHACALRDTLREVGPDEPGKLAERFDEVTETTVTPLYRMTLGFDRHRLAEIDGDIVGEPYRTSDPGWAITKALESGALRDPDVLRARSTIASLLATPDEVFAEPGVLDKVIAVGANAPQYPTPGATRSELLAAIGADDGVHKGGAPRPAPRVPAAAPTRRTGTLVDINGVGINVRDTGSGPAVLLIHGWPDNLELWRHQVAALTAAGYRTITFDLRGFGESDKPEAVENYGMIQLIGDVIGVLDHHGLERAHIVGHDWGGAIGATFAAMMPARAVSLTCLSVGHPAAIRGAGLSQREKSWYMLLFQFRGVAEEWLSMNDFANFKAWAQHPEHDAVIARLRERATLTAGLGPYRAVLSPETLIAPPPQLPPIRVPTMGVWSTGDIAITEQAMTGTAAHVAGPWRYERIEGVGHWMQLEAPDRVNGLLLDFLSHVSAETAAAAT